MFGSARIVRIANPVRRCLALVGIAAAFPVAAHATTFTVNSSADAGGICPGATCTLRQAIFTALPGDTIDFAVGLSTINLTSGELAINKNLIISGPGANFLTVQRSSASGTPTFRIFHTAGNISVTIAGLTISKGGDLAFGGGIFNDSATLTISDCIISANTTSSQNSQHLAGNGGGIYNLNGTLNIARSTLSGNSAYETGGAASNSGGTVTIEACIISGNSALDPFGGSGGGIFNDNGGTVNVTNSTLSNNGAPTVVSNFGGAIYNRNGTLTVTTSTLSNNRGDNGSGIFNGNGDTSIANGALATITDSTISGNSGGSSRSAGGGIFNLATLHIVRSTISGNNSPGVGGGISNGSGAGPGGTATIDSSTIAGNSANRGAGGIYNPGSVVARNTIIAKNAINSGGTGNTPDFSGTLTSQGFNLIGNGFGATITPAQSTDQVGTSASPIDPLLGPLQDNGGPTFTAALLSGSPAKDKGDSGGSNTDQRGFARPVDNPAIVNAAGGDGSDIGAFEAALAARSLNISARARVQTGENVLIGGFIITGNAPKLVVLRGLGPSLANAGIPASTVLNDPVLELHGSNGALITLNDNWKESPQRSQFEGTAFQPSDEREAVIWMTLPPAAYTAVVKGKGSDIGVGLVEVYDLDQGGDSTLTNLSSRAFVETGNDVLIGGFTLGANNGRPLIIIRALGPSLSQFGISHRLGNPTLELHNANGTLLVFNDNWNDDPAQASQIMAVGFQPKDNAESAIAAALPPGAYTAIVAGKDGDTGVGVVEIYNLQ
jgi:CSLREA domain-containing protein